MVNLPEPLEVIGNTVAYEFIRMPDSTGFGDYTKTGPVIPVRFTTPAGKVQQGSCLHAMLLDDNYPIAGGREIWGEEAGDAETVARAGDAGRDVALWLRSLRKSDNSYKDRELPLEPLAKAMAKPAFVLKVIPDVDGSPRICELVRYYLEDVTLKGAHGSGQQPSNCSNTRCATSRGSPCSRSHQLAIISPT
ncbi:acetoacetate decarboxylase [Rhizobium mesoamericanum]|nr:acetoacetate decarboxylase [Rhizobium mesoamericanum]